MKLTLRFVSILLTLVMLLPTFALASSSDPVLATNQIGVYPIVKEPITLTIGIESSASEDDLKLENNQLSQDIFEMTGIKVEFVIFSEVDAESKLMQMVISDTKLPDILTFCVNEVTNAKRNQIAEAGKLYPMDEFYDKQNGMAGTFYEQCEALGLDGAAIIDQLRATDGHLYGLPRVQFPISNMYVYRAFVNQDWLDVLGLKAPETLDELTTVLKAFRDGDPNGNGIKDEIPLTGCNATSISTNNNIMTWLQNMFIYRDKSDNLFLPLSKTDGKLDVSYDKEEYREFLKYMNYLVEEDLLDECAFTQTQKEMRAQLQADTPTIGMMVGSANGFGGNIESWSAMKNPVGYYGERITTTTQPTITTQWVITSDCEHPEAAFLLGAQGYDNSRGKYYWYYRCGMGVENVDWRYPLEGEVSVFKEMGIAPTIYRFESSNVEQTHCWGGAMFPYVAYNDCKVEVYDETKRITGERLHGMSVHMNIDYAPDVNDVVGIIRYTDEESAEWSDIRATLRTYINKAACQFAVGQLDPNNDTDWNNYLKELENLRYKELLAMDEAAYYRTIGK